MLRRVGRIAEETEKLGQLHSDLPRHAGERDLVRHLRASSDARLHIWCGLDFIPGVRDCDLLIAHEDVGFFLIEIKAVPLEELESYGWKKCKIKGRSEGPGPVNQAAGAVHSLKDYLKGRDVNLPLTPTAAWPLISRQRWNARWDDVRVCGEYAEKILFSDDLYSTPAALIERLRYFRANPVHGDFRQGDPVSIKAQIEMLTRELHVNAKPVQTQTDYQRLKIIEDRIAKEERSRVPPRSGRQWYYRGKPGTGKTFRLLRIGHWHAMEGLNVLYLCFNKVLASDVRRILHFSKKLPLASGSIEIRDVFDVLRRFLDERVDAKEPNEWAKAVVELMREKRDELQQFDTILIDEGQDLPDWAFDLVELHSSPKATVLVAAGTGQELYGEQALGLQQFRKKARDHRCNRNFRITEQIIKLAILFFDANADTSKLHAELRKLGTGESTQQDLIFERPGGALPNLSYLDDSELFALDEDDPTYPESSRQVRVDQYARVLEQEIKSLTASERPMDLLVLVPSETHFEHDWVRGALQKLGMPYLDYAEDLKRRSSPEEGRVRICTFHSARGIEGQRVVIFGLERLEELARRIGVSATNLGYIALSRASLDLTIAYRPKLPAPQLRFIEAAIDALRPKAGINVR